MELSHLFVPGTKGRELPTSSITTYKNPKPLSVYAEINQKASIRAFEIFSNGLFDWKPAC